ncbi:MAG: hypothetical protein WBE86_03990 [Candidatus Acidiferrales bacterium]
MRQWVKKWWWIAFVLTIVCVVAWQKERCDAQEQKCRADYASQESRLYGFSIDGNAAEQEAINAACEPNSEFCRLFSSANLPTWLLVLVGMGGIGAALRTLKTIQEQTKHNQTAAEAARDSADIMRLQAQSAALDVRRLNRAYLTVDSWTAKNIPASAEGPWRVVIRFSIYNPSRTAARIDRLDYKVGSETYSLPHGVMIMLTPQERHEVRIPAVPLTKTDNVVSIRGEITYRDIFRKERHRTFSQSLLCGDSNVMFYRAEVPGMNEEEEWDKGD